MSRVEYKVKEIQDGRAGWIIYTEDGKELRFPWEMISRGIGVSVPDASEWDAYCEKRSAGWAKGRRREILERVAEGARRRYWGATTVTFEEKWLTVQHGDFWLIRWLNKLFRIED